MDNILNHDIMNKIAFKYKNYENRAISIIDGVFLLFIVVAGNYVASTFGCQTQKILTLSIVAKQILLFFIIFFSLSFSQKVIENPSMKLVKTFVIYIFFLLFTKMHFKFTVFVLLLLIAIYINHSYKQYYDAEHDDFQQLTYKEKAKFQERLDLFTKTEIILTAILIITILIGFSLYYREKRKEHGHGFKLIKLMVGDGKCRGLKRL